MKEKRESRMGMSRYEEENGKERMGLGEKEGRGMAGVGVGVGGFICVLTLPYLSMIWILFTFMLLGGLQ